MGVVYRARHLSLKRPVALKMILAGGHAGPAERLRFRIEAEAVARLQHPHIVQIHEVGEHDGLPYCALELVDGGSLAQKLGERPLVPREAAQLVAALARAIHVAHSRNVVHRDLKPANVLLTADGIPKISDFGLARQLDADSGQTLSGAVMGTPSYMAPEQASGQAHAAGPLADVYSLGAILYACLTGGPPFRSDNVAETLEQVRSREPVPPSRFQPVPRDLETVCLKCLRKEPQQRYASAAELADDLSRFQEGRPVLARPVGGGERLLKWVRRNPGVASLLALVVFVALGGVIGVYWKYLDARAGQEEATRQAAIASDRAQEAAQQTELALGESRAKDKALRQAEEQNATNLVLLAGTDWEKLGAAAARARLAEVRGDRAPPLRRWEWHYLSRQFEGGLFTLYGHTNVVSGVVFSPDGRRLATASHDGTARLWDARSGAPLLELKGHTAEVTGLSFSPDGQRLATGSHDKTVRIWDARNGAQLLELKGHREWVHGVVFSPDGQRLATASDNTARVWDARSGELLLTFDGHRLGVTGVAFSPDGQHLATASDDRTARVWDAHTGVSLVEFTGHTGPVERVAFSPDGQQLATASDDKTARVWDAHSGALRLDLKGHSGPVNGVIFSPDGQSLATAGSDQAARLWDARSGALLLDLKGHSESLTGVTFSPDGQRLATASSDKTARVWDARNGAPLLELKGPAAGVSAVTFSPDSQRLATGSVDRTARVWDARSGELVLELQGHGSSVHAVAFSADGQRLATSSLDGTARIWNARTGTPLLELKGHGGGVNGVAFSPDGQRLATASHDRTARLWDARTGALLLELSGHSHWVYGVAFSPDGERLATTSQDRTVRLWDAHSGAPLLELQGHSDAVLGVAFSPDGQRLATASPDRTARIWDAHSGAPLFVLQGHTAGTSRVAFSPDSQHLATASYDRTARVWDARSGTPLVVLSGHTKEVSDVAFSPDGQRLATASGDRTVRLWEARNCAFPLVLKGHSGGTVGLAFSPDGQRLATASQDRTARVWKVRSGTPLLELKGHRAGVAGVAFSPDGERLATASDDATARLWDARSGAPLLELKGHSAGVVDVAFSPDGQRLATASDDKTARLWDARSGMPLLVLKGSISPLTGVVFSPDGERLTGWGYYGKALVWDVGTGRPDPAGVPVRVDNASHSPNGRYLALRDGLTLRLVDLSPPDADEVAYRLWATRSDLFWHLDEVERLYGEGLPLAAAFHLDQAILDPAPTSAGLLRRGGVMAWLDRWPKAQSDFAAAREQAPNNAAAWRGLALTQLAAGQTEAYQRTCADFRNHLGTPAATAVVGLLFAAGPEDVLAALPLPQQARESCLPQAKEARLEVARTCVLTPGGTVEPLGLLPLAGRDPFACGAVLCRAGRQAEAVRLLASQTDGIPLLWRALAECGQDQPVTARKTLEQFSRWLESRSSDDPKRTNAAQLTWELRLEVRLLTREVEACCRIKGAGDQP